MGCSVNGKPLLKAHSGKVGYVSSSLAQSFKKESSNSNMSFLEWFETLITEWCTGAQCLTISMACIKQIPADDRVREGGSSPFFSNWGA